jgi:hypothetical protein
MGIHRFYYRIAFGVWINDIRRKPIIDDWPSIIIDNTTMKDYTELILLLKQHGYNALDIFGLITNHDWPMDIASVIDSDRKKLVRDMIEIAHQHDMKIIYGLGVYSWGFNQIIRNDPEVNGTNPSAMCGSKPKSKLWQNKIIDFITQNFDIDGFHLEAADQGRCECEVCKREKNIAYFCRLNMQTAQYIRSQWPELLLLVNTSGFLPWGDFVTENDFKYMYDLGNTIDVFIDGGNHGLFIREEDRNAFIKGFPCSYGTSGGFWVYPPQRWDRTRWFIPYTRKTCEHLKKLYQDGGKACEIYMGPIINPGVELNIVCSGLFLSDVEKKHNDVLMESIDKLYRPHSTGAGKDLAELFMQSEDAFFSNWSTDRNMEIPEMYSDGIGTFFKWSKKHRNRTTPGELFLEPLFGTIPGFPVYLSLHMGREGRMKYKKDLQHILDKLPHVQKNFDDSGRIGVVARCISNMIMDIDRVNGIKELEVY